MEAYAMEVSREIVVDIIVKVLMNDVDFTKVDGKNLTLVVVEKMQHRSWTGPPKYKLECTKSS